MAQLTLSDLEYSLRRKKTKRERFLLKMDRVVPWKDLEETVRPYYPSGKRGRPPRGLETMLRMYLLQYWFGLSDEAVEDAIYDSYAMRTFMRLDFFQQQVPDSTTLLKFRHLLEANGLDKQVFALIGERLSAARLVLRCGSVTDASVTSAGSPSGKKDGRKKKESEKEQPPAEN